MDLRLTKIVPTTLSTQTGEPRREPRRRTAGACLGVVDTSCVAIQDSTAILRRVYVRAPVAADLQAWRDYSLRSAPDPARALREHAAFREVLK